jgi:hypothetical protein
MTVLVGGPPLAYAGIEYDGMVFWTKISSSHAARAVPPPATRHAARSRSANRTIWNTLPAYRG